MKCAKNRWLMQKDIKPLYAVEAYRVFTGSEKGGSLTNFWFVRWEDRFVRLDTDWELTEEQMGIIAERLLNCAE